MLWSSLSSLLRSRFRRTCPVLGDGTGISRSFRCNRVASPERSSGGSGISVPFGECKSPTWAISARTEEPYALAALSPENAVPATGVQPLLVGSRQVPRRSMRSSDLGGALTSAGPMPSPPEIRSAYLGLMAADGQSPAVSVHSGNQILFRG